MSVRGLWPLTRFGDETAPTPCLLILCASVTILFFYNNDTTSSSASDAVGGTTEGADAGERFYLGGGGERGVTKPELGPVEKDTSPGKTRRARSWNERDHWACLIRVFLGRSRETRPSQLLRRICPRRERGFLL